MDDEATAGRAVERARRHAQRMHELRAPLTVVMCRTQLVRRRLRRGDPPERVLAEREAIEGALVRLAAAIERLDDPAGGP